MNLCFCPALPAHSNKLGVDPKNLVVVSIMPCVRKQGEADRIMFHTDDGVRCVISYLSRFGDHCSLFLRQFNLVVVCCLGKRGGGA